MKVYGNVTLSEGSDISNMTVASGQTYPDAANKGEIFYHDASGLAVYTGSVWKSIQETTSSITQTDILSALGYSPVNKAGDVMLGNLGFSSAPGTALTIGSQYGWKDLIGDVAGKSSGTSAPQQKLLFSTVRGWAYSAGDQGDLLFHIPHDYAPGTDLFLHFHWTHNGTAVSGSLDLVCNITYAKGHQQQAFAAPITTHVTSPQLNIANSPQFMHRTEEIQISTAGGAAAMLNTSAIEVDGIILVSFTASTIPAITGSQTGINVPFLLSADLHYQTTSLPTKNKSPNFYE